jgi:hypothetical protein
VFPESSRTTVINPRANEHSDALKIPAGNPVIIIGAATGPLISHSLVALFSVWFVGLRWIDIDASYARVWYSIGLG